MNKKAQIPQGLVILVMVIAAIYTIGEGNKHSIIIENEKFNAKEINVNLGDVISIQNYDNEERFFYTKNTEPVIRIQPNETINLKVTDKGEHRVTLTNNPQRNFVIIKVN